MTPATTGGASRATRKSPPTSRVSQGAKKTAGASAASKKKAQAPVAKGARTGRVAGARSAAAAPAGATVRKAKTAPQKAVARARAGAPAASSAKPATKPQASRTPERTSRTPERSGATRAGGETKTTKAARKAATKATEKKVVTSTSRTAKEKEPSGASTVLKPATAVRQPAAAVTPPSAAPATARKKPSSRRAPAAPVGPYAQDEKFLTEQRQLLEAERTVYLAQASDLKAEADSLAQEREPGDVQFDEESGEGGTVTVDRERDLALSAQALAAVEEIDAALARIADRTYGECERCEQPIPKPRLKALPYARLCVACKSGGLSRR